MGSAKESSSSRGWTNERHVDFLNSMEASFVRTILLHNNTNNNINGNGSGCSPAPPPLDRYLPDTCDSTLDSNTQRLHRHSTLDTMDSTRNRIDKRNRRVLLQQPYNITSQDQVVPQFESKRGNNAGDMDKNGGQHLNVAPPN